MLQLADVVPALPAQLAPPNAGAGFVQVLAFLVFVPVPQVLEQVSQVFQADQPPLTKFKMFCTHLGSFLSRRLWYTRARICVAGS